MNNRVRVMHVEGNLANLILMERILARRPNVEVIAARQGRVALALAPGSGLDLILLDLHLPDMNGAEVLSRLRDDPRTADIPVIVVSGDATPTQVERLLAAGADGYVTKPIEVAGFLDVVDRALAAKYVGGKL
jgi:CheY-like chemotaxis protein